MNNIFFQIIYTLVKFKIYDKASIIPGLKVYWGPLFISLPCASQNAGREMAWNMGPANECEVQIATIPLSQ
jgi:hypothetical protein